MAIVVVAEVKSDVEVAEEIDEEDTSNETNEEVKLL